MTYGRVHRYLLRLIAGHGVLSLDETTRIVNSVAGETEINIKEMVKEINKKISPFQQMIKIVNDEVTSEMVVVFVTFGNDDATRAQTLFSQLELEFFRVLLLQIMTNKERQITDLAALNLVNDIKGLSKVEAQKTLDTWCCMRFLDKDSYTMNYALGVRAIHEFETYLSTNMPNLIMKCHRCHEIVFRGYNCPACPKAVHTRCLEMYLSIKRSWPCCDFAYHPNQLEQPDQSSPTHQEEEILNEPDDVMQVEEAVEEGTRRSKRMKLDR